MYVCSFLFPFPPFFVVWWPPMAPASRPLAQWWLAPNGTAVVASPLAQWWLAPWRQWWLAPLAQWRLALLAQWWLAP